MVPVLSMPLIIHSSYLCRTRHLNGMLMPTFNSWHKPVHLPGMWMVPSFWMRWTTDAIIWHRYSSRIKSGTTPGGGIYPKIILEDEAYPTDHTRLVHPPPLLAGIECRWVEGLQLFLSNSTPWLPLKDYHRFQPLTCRQNREGSSHPLPIA